MNGIIGKKLGMSRFFKDDGEVYPVTIIEAGPCPVLRVQETPAGKTAVQLGFGVRKAKRATKAGTDPSRVLKGKKLPGHHGAARHTETGLQVVKVDAEQNLLFVRGAVPGPMRGIVVIRKQGKKSRYA
jgi:ribosomal protein L3